MSIGNQRKNKVKDSMKYIEKAVSFALRILSNNNWKMECFQILLNQTKNGLPCDAAC